MLATLTAGEAADRVRRSFLALHRAGVPIVLGTDAGVLPHGANARELVALTEAGLSLLEERPELVVQAGRVVRPAQRRS